MRSDNRQLERVTATEGESMLVNCECGQVIRAEDESQLVASVERHVDEHHPELVGKLSRDQILAMAEDE